MTDTSFRQGLYMKKNRKRTLALDFRIPMLSWKDLV